MNLALLLIASVNAQDLDERLFSVNQTVSQLAAETDTYHAADGFRDYSVTDFPIFDQKRVLIESMMPERSYLIPVTVTYHDEGALGISPGDTFQGALKESDSGNIVNFSIKYLDEGGVETGLVLGGQFFYESDIQREPRLAGMRESVLALASYTLDLIDEELNF